MCAWAAGGRAGKQRRRRQGQRQAMPGRGSENESESDSDSVADTGERHDAIVCGWVQCVNAESFPSCVVVVITMAIPSLSLSLALYCIPDLWLVMVVVVHGYGRAPLCIDVWRAACSPVLSSSNNAPPAQPAPTLPQHTTAPSRPPDPRPRPGTFAACSPTVSPNRVVSGPYTRPGHVPKQTTS